MSNTVKLVPPSPPHPPSHFSEPQNSTIIHLPLPRFKYGTQFHKFYKILLINKFKRNFELAPAVIVYII